MPKKLGTVDRSVLTAAALPPATKTYTVISHSFIINTIVQALEDNGFELNGEEYKCTTDANVASGTFMITYAGDEDLNMMYSFNNSYDKSLRFRAAIGAQINVNGSYMVGNTDSWIRKHTGTADQEAHDLINDHIANASMYFDQLVQDKENMKQMVISKSEFGAILGELFIKDHLTVDQISHCRKQFMGASFNYEEMPSKHNINLWTAYMIIADALRQSHPAKWMSTQVATHLYFVSKYNITNFDEEETDEYMDPELSESNSEEDSVITEDISDEEIFGEVTLPGFDNNDDYNPENEEEINKRMNIIGQNGNEGLHYEEENASDHELPEWSEPTPEEHIENVVVEEKTTDEIVATVIDKTLNPVPVGGGDFVDGIDEVIEEPVTTEEPDTDVAHESTAEEFYFSADDYVGTAVGDMLEVDGEYYEITREETMEGDTYLIGIVASIEESTDEEVTEITDQDLVTTVDEIEATLAETTEEDVPFDISDTGVEATLEEETEVEDTLVQQVETPTVGDPVKDQIALEIEDLYGYIPEFTYTSVGDDYNVVLETGESFTLQAGPINARV